jgi:hypothetical protein
MSDNSVLIGIINFEEDLSESEIISATGRLNPARIGICKVNVYANEGQKPHFHLYKLNGNSEFETCICIYSNNYFSHGGKYTSTLNSKQCRELNTWLKQSNKTYPNLSNWEAAVYEWERGNGGKNFKNKVSIQPDYDKMNMFSDV